MTSKQDHRKHLSNYLTQRKQDHLTGSKRSSAGKKSIAQNIQKHHGQRKGKATIYHVPKEIILKIFGYLSMGDLLSVAQVCQGWHQLSSDNLLWKPLLRKCVPSGGDNSQIDLKTANLKSSFMQRCIEMKNKRILRFIKKKNPYTGMTHSKDVESAIKFGGISWQVVLTDTSSNEHRLQHQDITYHQMSVSVRWYSLTMIPVSNVKKLEIYTCNPLFFDNSTGRVVSKGPYKRSLMYSLDTKLSSVIDKLKPVGSDENLKVYALQDGIILGIWKEGGDIAFIALSHALPGLVKRCIMGSSYEIYQPAEKLPIQLAESSYGLYGYSCTIQLRTMKQELWDHQFTNVECPNCNIRNDFAQFSLLKESERQMMNKDLTFPWKTDAFKGKIKDACCIDVVMVNNEGQLVWFCSTAVSVKKDGTRGKMSFGMDFDYCREMSRCIEFSDERGKLYIQIDKDDVNSYITCVTLEVSLCTLSGKNPGENKT